eukprot:scaffold26800_cov127-Cylindrotheca_fusiformis.AAC.4
MEFLNSSNGVRILRNVSLFGERDSHFDHLVRYGLHRHTHPTVLETKKASNQTRRQHNKTCFRPIRLFVRRFFFLFLPLTTTRNRQTVYSLYQGCSLIASSTLTQIGAIEQGVCIPENGDCIDCRERSRSYYQQYGNDLG